MSAVEYIAAALADSVHGPATYVRVTMREPALAKSYRPNRALFVPDRFPCVGADGVGELYYRVAAIHLPFLLARLGEAEATVEWRVSRTTGRPYQAVSRLRSEVGAIQSMKIPSAVDKRGFSASEAVKALAEPTTVSGYQVELFDTPSERVIADDPLGERRLAQSLMSLLCGLGRGARSVLVPSIGRTPVLEVQLTTDAGAAVIEDRRAVPSSASRSPTSSTDPDVGRHEAALVALARHPLVRAIRPPVQLALAEEAPASSAGDEFSIPVRNTAARYPVLGVIDSGLPEWFGAWRVGRFDFLDEADCDPNHGAAVATLALAGRLLNGPMAAPETDGCDIYDAALYPRGDFKNAYPNGFNDFLEELEQAVAEAKAAHGVRVFNLSINAVSPVEEHRYSIYAARLDQIADAHDVIFVNSAGNLPIGSARSGWPARPSDVLAYFARRTQPDTILKPAESVRSISVGALNPPGGPGLSGAPTAYTRRGPGLQVGVKPDLASYGGAACSPPKPSGLVSVGRNQRRRPVAGTSYAAPLVARSLASLDAATEGTLSCETLRAMLVHGATMPPPLARRGMGTLSRQFVGFGQPRSSAEMLETDDHQVSMVFQSRLTAGARKPAILRFDFPWPRCLVSAGGACSGRVRLTLVYRPPLDPAFGAEFVRVNVDAKLLQRQAHDLADGRPAYANVVRPIHLPSSAGMTIPERTLVQHGLKWWPVKRYEAAINSRGESSSWRLEVSSLTRAETAFPAEGVPFGVILTIEDPEGRRPVFQEMRQALAASRAIATDIRTVARARV